MVVSGGIAAATLSAVTVDVSAEVYVQQQPDRWLVRTDRVKEVDGSERTRELFRQHLAQARKDDKTIVWFIHGFNVTPDEALESATVIQKKLGATVLVVPLLWHASQSSNDVYDGYRDVLKNVPSSAKELKPVFEMMTGDGNGDCVLAHSMGNRVLLTMAGAVHPKPVDPANLSQVYHVSADVPWDVYSDEDSRYFDGADNLRRAYVHAYYHSRDMALLLSALAPGRFSDDRRMGRKGPKGDDWESTAAIRTPEAAAGSLNHSWHTNTEVLSDIGQRIANWKDNAPGTHRKSQVIDGKSWKEWWLGFFGARG